MNRGSQVIEKELASGDPDPSMRPRFMNRGSQSEGGRLARFAVPSMRPRFMNRGSSAAELSTAEPSAALQ